MQNDLLDMGLEEQKAVEFVLISPVLVVDPPVTFNGSEEGVGGGREDIVGVRLDGFPNVCVDNCAYLRAKNSGGINDNESEIQEVG